MKELKLTGGEVALVDSTDYDWLDQWNWTVLKTANTSYAVRQTSDSSGARRTVMMHRVILETPKGMEADHINGNGLDNRRENIRTCTHAQNMCNRVHRATEKCTSKYKGAQWYAGKGKWRVSIRFRGKRTHVGYFNSEIEAAEAYDKKAKELHGSFASLNFPDNN